MYALLAAAALAVLPLDLTSSETSDVIELNHFYDDDGRKVFDQVIFWDWHANEGAYRVRAWRLWKGPHQNPWRSSSGGGFVTVWQDDNRLRRVQAHSLRETWTQFDPELADREFLAPGERRGLLGEKPAVPRLPPDNTRPAGRTP